MKSRDPAHKPIDARHREQLRALQVDELYRRAPVPTVLFVPLLGIMYLVLADVAAVRPAITLEFLALAAVVVVRLCTVLGHATLRRRLRDPRLREAVFAAGAAAIGCGLAAINLTAAPVASVEQLTMMAFIAAGINSVGVVSMTSSLWTYIVYMVPNMGSVAIALLMGPPLRYGQLMSGLVVLNLLVLAFIAVIVHLGHRRSILLRLRMDDANEALQGANRQLKAEIADRLRIEAALEQRNVQLEGLAEQLAGAQSQLLQSEKMASVGQLAAGVAHEINNPIAFVRSNLGSLKAALTDIFAVLEAGDDYAASDGHPNQRAEFERVQRAVNLAFLREDIPALLAESFDGLTRVEKIVRDLKDFSHVDRKEEWQRVDLHECIESSLTVAAHELKYKATVVRDYGVLPHVECLPFQINQVLLNLLINAAQAFAGRGTITLRTRREGDEAVLEVADDGPGIAPEHLPRIFEPFFTTKPIGVGTGLGLSVSYGIVRKHGGSIDVKSRPGQGTTFTIRLPLARSEVALAG